MARDGILTLIVSNILNLYEIFENVAENDLQTRSSGSLELFAHMRVAHIGKVPFKDYLKLQMFENSE